MSNANCAPTIGGPASRSKIGEFGPVGELASQFSWPTFLDCDENGENVIVADTDNCRVQFFYGQHLSCPTVPPFGYKGGELGAFNYPRSAVYYAPGSGIRACVADTENRRVVMLAHDGEPTDCKANFKPVPVHQFGVDIFREPTDIAVDKETGYLYVTDMFLNKVMIHDPEGRTVGECVISSPNTRLQDPMGITIDKLGRVLVVDKGHDCIKLFDKAGRYLGVVGKTGTALGQFIRPKGIAVSDNGMIFIADEQNNRVQMMTPDLVYFQEVCKGLEDNVCPFPVGVAVSRDRLYVTTAEKLNFVKVYKISY